MAGSKAAYDVLVIGGAGVDTVVRLPSLEVPDVDSVDVPTIREWAGHTGIGVALGCRALGLDVRFTDFVGEDHFGDIVRERLAAGEVTFVPLISSAGTRRAVNLVDDSGNRLSFYDGRDAGSLRMPRENYLPLMRQARHAHFSIMNFVRYLYGDAVELGLQVSTDLHDWDGESAHHRDFAHLSDVVFLSTSALGGRFAEVMRSILARGRAHTVVAMAGAEGSYVMTHERDEAVHVPAARPTAPVVDSNGAGDAFVSGYLLGLLSGRPAEVCAELGAVAGAHACTAEGPHSALIGRAALEAGVAWGRGAHEAHDSGPGGNRGFTSARGSGRDRLFTRGRAVPAYGQENAETDADAPARPAADSGAGQRSGRPTGRGLPTT